MNDTAVREVEPEPHNAVVFGWRVLARSQAFICFIGVAGNALAAEENAEN
jgi:hypothetical protein